MGITPDINPTTVRFEGTIPMTTGRKIRVILSKQGEQEVPIEYEIPAGFNSASVFLYVKISLKHDNVNSGG